MPVDYTRMSEYRFNLVNKETGHHTYDIVHCVGNPFELIRLYKADMSKMCLVGVSSETHQIESVKSLATGRTIYNDPYYKVGE